MNPELERRLRRFGATVDTSAEAAESARRAAATRRSAGHLVDVSDLEPVAPARRPPSATRIFLAAAAAVAVIGAGVILLNRATSSPDIATGQISSTADTEPDTTLAATPIKTDPSTTILERSTTSSTSTSVATTNPPVCPTYRANEAPPLRLCDQGENVRLVQQRLNETVAAGLNVDGNFGPGTRDAVRQFQRDHALEVDGLVGPATWAALFPESATTTTPVPPPS